MTPDAAIIERLDRIEAMLCRILAPSADDQTTAANEIAMCKIRGINPVDYLISKAKESRQRKGKRKP